MSKTAGISGFPQRISTDIVLSFTQEYPNSAFMEFDFDVYYVFGSRARIPVKLSVDGHTFRSSLAPMGGCHMMVFNRQMRETTGYKAGDKIHILLERDIEPRTVELPDDVKTALQDAGTLDVLLKYSYSHQKEVLDWINDAKKPETRLRRIAQLTAKLCEDEHK